MDRLKFYKNLISSGHKNRCMKGLEKHHVLPKSIFNDEKARLFLDLNTLKDVDDDQNIVFLELRKHYIAHRVLASLFFNVSKNAEIKMLTAWNMMRLRTSCSNNYKVLKTHYCDELRKRLLGKPSGSSGCRWSQEAKERKSQQTRGKSYEQLYGVQKAQELKQVRSQQFKKLRNDPVISKKINKSLSERVFTDEWRKKLSLSARKKKSQKWLDSFRKMIKDDKKNPNVNQTLYSFKNANTGEQVCCRIIDMHKRKINAGALVKKRTTKTKDGWILLQGEDGGKTCR